VLLAVSLRGEISFNKFIYSYGDLFLYINPCNSHCHCNSYNMANAILCVYVSSMGARRIFFRGEQIRDLRTKVPQLVPAMEPGGAWW